MTLRPADLRFALGMLVLLAATSPTYASEAVSWQDEVRTLVSDAMDDHGVVGASVAIVRGDETLLAEGFGFADAAQERPVTADTLFRVGSITKTLTAIAVMQLVDDGMIALDDPFGDHLPGFAPAPPVRDADGWSSDQITVRSLLTHHSGLIGDVYQGMFADQVHAYTDYVELIRGVPAASRPDHAWAYSNVAFTLLGHMVETKRGQAYVDVVRERILEPAGMATATFDLDDPALSLGYAEGDAEALPDLGMLPAGSLNASANDLARYSQMLLAGGAGARGRVLPETRLREMGEPQNGAVALDLDLRMGLGFFRSEDPQLGLRLGHSGGTAYFVTVFYVVPEHDLAVVLLTNSREGGPMIGEVARELGEIALAGLAGHPRVPEAEPAEATDNVDETTVARWAGHYQTPLGHLDLVPRGKRLRADVGGQTLELRATDRGTFVPYAILFGFIPLRPRALQAIEVGFTQVGDRDLMFQRTPEGLRGPAGVRITPVPATPAWRDRVGEYEVLNAVGDRVFDGFALEETDGILELVVEGPMLPPAGLRLAAEPVTDTRLLVPGLGRNRGDVVDVVAGENGEEIHYSGFRARKIAD